MAFLVLCILTSKQFSDSVQTIGYHPKNFVFKFLFSYKHSNFRTYVIIHLITNGNARHYSNNRIRSICLWRLEEGKTVPILHARSGSRVFVQQEEHNCTVTFFSGFVEIAGKVASLTRNAVVVAHQAAGVYQILKAEYRRIGQDFEVPFLCTAHMSKILIPHLTSYELEYMTRVLGIYPADAGDALWGVGAVSELFSRLIQLDEGDSVLISNISRRSKRQSSPGWIDQARFEELPVTSGIYTFRDREGEIIYVGKAKNIRRRALSHFTSRSEKEIALCQRTGTISFELCGNDLIALLREAELILDRRPEGNTLQKKEYPTYHIVPGKNREGILCFQVERKPFRLDATEIFFRKGEALSKLKEIGAHYRLCPKYSGLVPRKSKCIATQEMECPGICQGLEQAGHYNVRARKALNALEQGGDFLILGQGRHSGECSMVLVQNGVYQGYGFADTAGQIKCLAEIEHLITPRKHTYHTSRIIAGHLLRHPGSKIILNNAHIYILRPDHTSY